MILRNACSEYLGMSFDKIISHFLAGCEDIDSRRIDYEIISEMCVATKAAHLLKGAVALLNVCNVIQDEGWTEFSNRKQLVKLFSGAALDISKLLIKEVSLLLKKPKERQRKIISGHFFSELINLAEFVAQYPE